MKISFVRSALPIVAALTFGACAPDTDDAAAEAAGADADVTAGQSAGPVDQAQQMAMIAEIQAIEQQLGPLQDEALADAGMITQREALEAKVEAAMEEAVPGSGAKRAEFDSLIGDYQTAQTSGDQETIAELEPRLQTLDQELRQAQQAAMQRDDIREAIEAFQADLTRVMRGLDESAGELLDRRDELYGELQSMMEPAGN